MTHRNLVLLAGAGSLYLLAAAFGFQFLGYAPCKMCLWQRWPHAAAIVIAGIVLLWGVRPLAWAGALAMFVTSGIGVFHSGVERKLWEGPTSCTSSGTGGLSSDQLFDQIMSAPLVRCDEIPWELFGLTMANLNALFSLAFALLWIRVAMRRD